MWPAFEVLNAGVLLETGRPTLKEHQLSPPPLLGCLQFVSLSSSSHPHTRLPVAEQEVNVYGVAIPGLDGRAGMAAVVLTEGARATGEWDGGTLWEFVTGGLPRYACPLFLREREAMEVTGSFKHKKVDLVAQGFDPGAVGGDRLWFRDDEARCYVPMGASVYDGVVGGRYRL